LVFEEFLKDNSGQAEAVFRLIIDSIVAFGVLLIILSAIGSFQEMAISQSLADLKVVVQSAVNSPDGQIITSSDLTFKKGFAVDVSDTQNWTGLSAECFRFDAREGSIDLVEESRVEFKQLLTLKVYSMCSVSGANASCDPKVIPTSEADCCFKCLISFGKKIAQ
jgi:hypothetical protein